MPGMAKKLRRDELELVLVFLQAAERILNEIEVNRQILTHLPPFQRVVRITGKAFQVECFPKPLDLGNFNCLRCRVDNINHTESKKELKDPGAERTTAAAG